MIQEPTDMAQELDGFKSSKSFNQLLLCNQYFRLCFLQYTYQLECIVSPKQSPKGLFFLVTPLFGTGGTGGEPSSSDCAQASQQNQPQQQPLPSESILEVSDDVATAAKGVSGRSKFIQIAGEALLSAGDEAAAVAGDSSTPKGAKPETGNTAGPLRQPQPRLPSPGVISDAGTLSFCDLLFF